MTRPSKYTTAIQDRIVEALKMGATYKLAASYGGIAEDTFHRWRTEKPAFAQAVAEAEAIAAMIWLAKIERATTDDWRAAAWKLERRFPREYGRSVQEQEHSGSIDINISRREGGPA